MSKKIQALANKLAEKDLPLDKVGEAQETLKLLEQGVAFVRAYVVDAHGKAIAVLGKDDEPSVDDIDKNIQALLPEVGKRSENLPRGIATMRRSKNGLFVYEDDRATQDGPFFDPLRYDPLEDKPKYHPLEASLVQGIIDVRRSPDTRFYTSLAESIDEAVESASAFYPQTNKVKAGIARILGENGNPKIVNVQIPETYYPRQLRKAVAETIAKLGLNSSDF